jgi:hypothetical protein
VSGGEGMVVPGIRFIDPQITQKNADGQR